ncbi:TPA: CRISPR-associated endonuclease Cas1 [Campylobacter lari]|uniref:CRISPR-associated endonuclease Cas1 n=1 Tax=Campylobacter sp. FU_497 TaxID=2911610 RepID=UPI0021E643FB|nr:CRISPR-associated endonuclease Cas1 [Campylobacter sp. FU_497]MCV3463261.1 CRISPR-associated endonuclease Cas1 [Campylobacter sp. FU_497]HEC1759432.1 CRISPR-associated endonuclease Cas1 [Campylobacter lari]
MYEETLEEIYTFKALYEAFESINFNTGLDELSKKDFCVNLNTNLDELKNSILTNTYTPEPLKQIYIEKENDKKRPIAISSIKDKLVQKVLYTKLSVYFESLFSNRSYAYRKGKSIVKALNRVNSLLAQQYHFILKSDIKEFFDSINQNRLINLLKEYIKDENIIKLLALFIKNGSFCNIDYKKHILGIHQGDILSPLLSNIYLNSFDRYLETKNYEFIRYADDFVVLFKEEKQAKHCLLDIENFLCKIDLSLNKEKTYITNYQKGFVFLGVEFIGSQRNLKESSLQKILSKIKKLAYEKDFIKEANVLLESLKNYYFKILTKDCSDYILLKNSFLNSLTQKLISYKNQKTIIFKKDFKNLLKELNLSYIIDAHLIDDIIELIVSDVFNKSIDFSQTDKKLNQKAREYDKKFAQSSTLYISQAGSFIGINHNSFVLKMKNKIIKKFPKEKIKRIILEGQGVSFSTDLIYYCAKNQISIDFIDHHSISYAQLISYKNIASKTALAQLEFYNSPRKLEIAKEIITSKTTNQLNYLKYLNKYHKNLTSYINQITKIIKLKIPKAQNTDELLGYEGIVSNIYYSCFKENFDFPFEARVTYKAKDLVNSSLNYAYAILYGKIQHYLVQAGLNLNISFLHAIDSNKPTLCFDMIEEFRTFIVDRTIISMFNKEEPLKIDSNGMLDKQSKILIIKNINEKLNSYTKWKKQSIKCENIIQHQCYHLARVINNKDKKYNGFIGKY